MIPGRTQRWCRLCVVAELFSDVQETSAMAESVSDSDGVCFVPSFSGLQVRVDIGSVFTQLYHTRTLLLTGDMWRMMFLPSTCLIIYFQTNMGMWSFSLSLFFFSLCSHCEHAFVSVCALRKHVVVLELV